MPPTTRQNCQNCQELKAKMSNLKSQLATSKKADTKRIQQRDLVICRLRKRLDGRDLQVLKLEETVEKMEKELAEKTELLDIVQQQKEDELKRKDDEKKPRCGLPVIIKTDAKWKPLEVPISNPSMRPIYVVTPDGKETKVTKDGKVSLTRAILEEGERAGKIMLEVYSTLRDHTAPSKTANVIKMPLDAISLSVMIPEEFIDVQRDPAGQGYIVSVDNSVHKIPGLIFEKAKGSSMDYGNNEQKAFELPSKKLVLKMTPVRGANQLLIKLKSTLQEGFTYSVKKRMAKN